LYFTWPRDKEKKSTSPHTSLVMNKVKNQVNLNKTLAFTKSSYSYKDPYLVNGSLLYKAIGKVKSFVAIRNMENEFIDFKSYHLDS